MTCDHKGECTQQSQELFQGKVSGRYKLKELPGYTVWADGTEVMFQFGFASVNPQNYVIEKGSLTCEINVD